MNATATQTRKPSEMKKAKATKEREIRVRFCMDNLFIDEDVFDLFALVPSTSKENEFYSVAIDKDTMQAKRCTCEGFQQGWYCVHCESVDRFYARCNMHLESVVVEEPAELVTVGEAITAANEQIMSDIREAAIAGDKSYAEAVGFYRPSKEQQLQQYHNYENGIAGLGNVA